MTPPDDLTTEEWALLRVMWPLKTSPAVYLFGDLTPEARLLARGLEKQYISRVSGGWVLTLRGFQCFEGWE